MKKQNGITLIALVISIIVMLILAGVSINAVIGDNGVIGKAQETLYLQSCAILEEFLQMEASNYALEENPYKTQYGLLRSKHPGWFYQNAQGYILDSDGHVMYLIKKSGLPQEIQDQITGGDASKVSQYYKQVDVYGVTSDLQVYYCNNGTDTILGLITEDLDKDNPLEIAYDEESLLSKVVNGTNAEGKANEALSEQDLKSIKTLTINTTEKLALLSEFIKLPTLQTVYFENITIQNLNGIQNAPSITEIRFTNCSVSDYSAICGLTKLNKLYLIKPAGKNTDVATLCSMDKGIVTAEFSNLRYFGIVGNATYIQSTETNYNNTRYDITDISGLANLSKITKEAIQYMYLQNLQLPSISSLVDYKNVIILRVEYNALTTFEGIQNMSNLTHLFAPYLYSNSTSKYTLGINETENINTSTDALSYIYKDESGKNTKLNTLDIKDSKSLKHVNYLSVCTALKTLYMSGSKSFIANEVAQIANVYEGCKITTRSMDSSYRLQLNNDTRIDYSNLSLTDTSDYIVNLKNNTTVQELNLTGNSNLTDSKLQEILSSMTNMKALCLANCSNLASIDFVKNMPNLVELDVRGTKVTDLGLLEEYGSSLKTLVVNNADTRLDNIQKTISHLNGQYEKTWLSQYVYGLCLWNDSLFSKLENLADITYLGMWNRGLSYGTGLNIDLTGCTSLETIAGYFLRCNFKLPASLKNNNMAYAHGAIWDFSLCTSITDLKFSDCWISSQDQFDTIIKSFENNTILKSITFTSTNPNVVKNFDALQYLKNTNIETFTFDGITHNRYGASNISGLKYISTLKNINIYPGYVEDISFLNPVYDESGNLISGCPNLMTLNLKKNNIKDLTGIENLTNLTSLNLEENQIKDIDLLAGLTNLTYLNLNSNNINNVKPLEKLKKLQTIYLQNNALYDNFADTTGKSHYTLTFFADLNQNQDGSLKNLYLSGNSIEDFSMLQDSNLKWDAKSGW